MMTIQPLAFANALALATLSLWALLIILRYALPAAFIFIFNAQFFGADVASLLPKETDIVSVLGEMAAFVGGAWGFGVVGAILYNRLISR
ncbi:MAG TPA: DUF5676 family membrane protein [Nitrospiraceae bacterium]|nr:DUF5676 family membrane protein [Nitrospiraceae bacterium]